MKVYFTASLRGKDKYAKNYKKIVEDLQKLGVTVYSEHILNNEDWKLEDTGEMKSTYKKVTNLLKSADLVVAEVSYPSISVGHEISRALDLNKAVLALSLEDNDVGLIEGIANERFQFIRYKLEDLSAQLAAALKKAEDQIDVRFNFFVSPKILAYLDWVAKNRMTPRSVFLRDLIEKEMKKDKEYKS